MMRIALSLLLLCAGLQAQPYMPAKESAGATFVQRCLFCLDISKSTYTTGNTNPMSLSLWGPIDGTGTNMADVSQASFFDKIQDLHAIPLNNIKGTAVISPTVAAWDNVFVMWGNSAPLLEISELAVIRFG
jgi:hypothetical protein